MCGWTNQTMYSLFGFIIKPGSRIWRGIVSADMEFSVSVQAQPSKELSQIVEGYAEFIELMLRKPIS